METKTTPFSLRLREMIGAAWRRFIGATARGDVASAAAELDAANRMNNTVNRDESKAPRDA
mgnify:CR=1 FL=1